MDERMKNLNLVEILKDCPEGTKLYSPLYGDVELVKVHNDGIYPIQVKLRNYMLYSFAKDGRVFAEYNGECMLFPSREERNWDKFKVKKPKFDPKTLKPFDKVLVINYDLQHWCVGLFSHYIESDTYPCKCAGDDYKYCIPYNDDTKHLVGTTEEAPEFYRYWED